MRYCLAIILFIAFTAKTLLVVQASADLKTHKAVISFMRINLLKGHKDIRSLLKLALIE